MSAPYKGKSFVGTFGGCKAGTLLDELLVGINNPKLITKISKTITPWIKRFRDSCRYIHNKSLRSKVLGMFRDKAIEQMRGFDFSEFEDLTLNEKFHIVSYSRNILCVEYRKAMNSELGLD